MIAGIVAGFPKAGGGEAGAHRYWSLEFTGVAPTGNWSLFELIMRSTPGGENLAPAATPIGLATTIGGGTLSFDKATDGNNGTRYVSDDDVSGWAGSDFGSAVEIVEYAVVGSSGINPAVNPTGWNFRYSDNGTTWTTVDTRAGIAWVDAEKKTFSI